jgi:hypothetical protein
VCVELTWLTEPGFFMSIQRRTSTQFIRIICIQNRVRPLAMVPFSFSPASNHRGNSPAPACLRTDAPDQQGNPHAVHAKQPLSATLVFTELITQ